MENQIIIPRLKQSVIRECKIFSWKSTKCVLSRWLKEDTVEYQQFINIPDDCNVIGYACYYGYIELVSLFVKNGFPVNQKLAKGFYPDFNNMLHFATIGRQVPLMKFLISSGANVNCCSDNGTTPLHCVVKGTLLFNPDGQYINVPKVKNSQEDVMKCLLESGCNVNVKDETGISPVYYAVQPCNIDAIKLLITYKADVNIVTKSKKTPLLCSLETMRPRFEIVEILLDAGASVSSTPLQYSTFALCYVISLSKFSRTITRKRADVDSGGGPRYTPLYQYAFILNPIVDNEEYTFVGENGINIVGTLIIWGANIKIFYSDGHSLLHWAAWQGSVNLVKLLLDKGIDVKYKFGKKAIDYAADSSHHEVVHCFIDYYYSIQSD